MAWMLELMTSERREKMPMGLLRSLAFQVEPKAAAVDPFWRHSGRPRAAAILFVAVMMLAQAAFVAASAGIGADLRVLCSSQDTQDGQARPALPGSRHHHSGCCILHCGIVGAPPPHQQVAINPQEIPAVIDSWAGIAFASTLRIDPKGAPQSPRAPPFDERTLSA
jgi:hypothetical protein